MGNNTIFTNIFDKTSVRYFWIDKSINTQQNQYYLQKIKEQGFQIQACQSLDKLDQKLRQIQTSTKIRIISSASFDNNVYNKFQLDDKIDRVILFCGNKPRAGMLIKQNSKIKAACFVYTQVISILMDYRRQDQTTLIFFNDEQIKKVNLQTSILNYFIKKPFGQQQSKNLIQYLNAFASYKQKRSLIVKQFQKYFQKNKKQTNLFTKQNNQMLKMIVRQTNQLLKSSIDPSKLVYIHWPVLYLHNFIINNYKKAINTLKFYGTISLNEQQKKKVIKKGYIRLNQFSILQKSPLLSSPNFGQCCLEIKINVSQAQKYNYGYAIFGQPAQYCIFHPKNYYKIQSFTNSFPSTLNITLIQISKKFSGNQNEEYTKICLNSSYSQRPQQIQQGYWLSLKLDLRKQQAKLIQKQNLNMQKIRLIISQEEQITGFKNIAKIIQRIINPNQRKQVIQLYLSQIIIRSGLDNLNIKETLQNIDQSTKIGQLLKIAFNIKKQKSPKSDSQTFKQLFLLLNKIQQTLDYKATVEYQLCLHLFSQAYSKSQQYQKQISIIDKLLFICTCTQGKFSRYFNFLNNWRITAENKRNQALNQSQKKIKDKLVNPNLKMFRLIENNQKFRLNLNKQRFDSIFK